MKVEVPQEWIEDVFRLTDSMIADLNRLGELTEEERQDFLNNLYQLGGCVEQMQQSDLLVNTEKI